MDEGKIVATLTQEMGAYMLNLPGRIGFEIDSGDPMFAAVIEKLDGEIRSKEFLPAIGRWDAENTSVSVRVDVIVRNSTIVAVTPVA